MDNSEPESVTGGDGRLRRQFRHGNELERLAAFTALFNKNVRPVLSLLRRYIVRAEDREDVAQNAFFQAWNSRDMYDGDRSFEPWLFEIVRNKARDHLRHKAAGDKDPVKMASDHSSHQHQDRDPTPLPTRSAATQEPSWEYRVEYRTPSGTWSQLADVGELRDLLDRHGGRGQSLEFRTLLVPAERKGAESDSTPSPIEHAGFMAALNSLTAQERTARVARLLATRLKLEEIADVLGWTLNAFKKHDSCGLKKICIALGLPNPRRASGE